MESADGVRPHHLIGVMRQADTEAAVVHTRTLDNAVRGAANGSASRFRQMHECTFGYKFLNSRRSSMVSKIGWVRRAVAFGNCRRRLSAGSNVFCLPADAGFTMLPFTQARV
jgi:hypothetical protein